MSEEYVLGHTSAELARLDAQAAALAEPTRLGMDTARQRMASELAEARAVLIAPTLVAGWATKR